VEGRFDAAGGSERGFPAGDAARANHAHGDCECPKDADYGPILAEIREKKQ
jgi:hypothetical protein